MGSPLAPSLDQQQHSAVCVQPLSWSWFVRQNPMDGFLVKLQTKHALPRSLLGFVLFLSIKIMDISGWKWRTKDDPLSIPQTITWPQPVWCTRWVYTITSAAVCNDFWCYTVHQPSSSWVQAPGTMTVTQQDETTSVDGDAAEWDELTMTQQDKAACWQRHSETC